MEDLIIIIPTHNRQHYLRRVIKYYTEFPCKVYICDSSKEKADIEISGNIIYRWVPQSNFYGKVLDVLNETSADFYALSPDDDFLKQETLMECYEVLKENDEYSLGIGKQIFFDMPFHGNFYMKPGANNLSDYMKKDGEPQYEYIKRFWYNYQNILWSLYKRKAIYSAFTTLLECNFNNGNFIEIVLGIESLRNGKVYVSKDGLNYREINKNAHWGNTVLSINRKNINKDDSLRKDVEKFYSHFNDSGFAKYCLTSYLNSNEKYPMYKRIVIILQSLISKCFKSKSRVVFLSRFIGESKRQFVDDIMISRINRAVCNNK